ncbi:hypothetical protein TNCV_1994261 [Trichonephila clavipes]|nr:hypothetical protein TNCV_1994261 [Trichonephila clavipes]
MATGSFISHNYSSSQSEVPRDYYNLFTNTESIVTVQLAFRIKFGCQPPNDNLGGKSVVYGEPSVTGSTYLDALQLWLFPQLEEDEPDIFIWQQVVHRLTDISQYAICRISLYLVNGLAAKGLMIKLASYTAKNRYSERSTKYSLLNTSHTQNSSDANILKFENSPFSSLATTMYSKL